MSERDLTRLDVGDHVQDREADDAATMVVVGTPVETAEAYRCHGETIADYNPDYPADDDVIEVVYPQRTDIELPDDEYAFPRSRLRLEEPVHNREAEEVEADD